MTKKNREKFHQTLSRQLVDVETVERKTLATEKKFHRNSYERTDDFMTATPTQR